MIRWIKSSGGSLKASWASSSVSFLFSGTKLSFYAGPGTERRDEANGGTPMIAIMVGPTREATPKSSLYWRTVDPEANSEVLILDETTHPEIQEKTFIRIMLIDWASMFELGALIYDDKGIIEPLPPNSHDKTVDILFIGDSISTGYAIPAEEGGESVPFGVFAQRRLLENEEKEDRFPPGMCDAFFNSTPWDRESFEVPWPDAIPKAIVIELGTNDEYSLGQFPDISFERFATTLEEFTTKLAKMFEASLQYIWLVPPFLDKDTENQDLSQEFPPLITRLEN